MNFFSLPLSLSVSLTRLLPHNKFLSLPLSFLHRFLILVKTHSETHRNPLRLQIRRICLHRPRHRRRHQVQRVEAVCKSAGLGDDTIEPGVLWALLSAVLRILPSWLLSCMHHYKPSKKKKTEPCTQRERERERERERASLEKEKWSNITNPVKQKQSLAHRKRERERERGRAWRKKSGNGFEKTECGFERNNG
jgi:hypothetical protein